MNTNLVIQKKSALSENIKMSSLTQEVIRRLLNCSEMLEDSCRVESLNNLAVKMCTSGYNTIYIRKVMVAGIKGYEKRLANSRRQKTDPKYKPLHLSKSFNAVRRMEKKLLAKTNWFKEGGDEQEEDNHETAALVKEVNSAGSGSKSSRRLERRRRKCKASNPMNTKSPSTVMFVDWTKGGVLAGKLKAEEDRLTKTTGFRIKFVESGGTPLANMFSTNLAKGAACGRQDCHTCKQGDDPLLNCFARSVVYESSCTICHKDGKSEKSKQQSSPRMDGKGSYTGETSRSIFERVKEHWKAADEMDQDSHMVKHWFLDHPELMEQPAFRFRIIGKFKDCLSRQIAEAVRLSLRPNSLNSKGEYGRCVIPRLVVEESAFLRQKREKEESLEATAEKERWEEFMQEKESRKEPTRGMDATANTAEGGASTLPHTAADFMRIKKRKKRDQPAPMDDQAKRRRMDMQEVIPEALYIEMLDWLPNDWNQLDIFQEVEVIPEVPRRIVRGRRMIRDGPKPELVQLTILNSWWGKGVESDSGVKRKNENEGRYFAPKSKKKKISKVENYEKLRQFWSKFTNKPPVKPQN